MLNTVPPRPRAVLVGIQLPGVSDEEHAADLAELGRLVQTLGYDSVARVSQRRQGIGSAALLGTGKLQELAKLTGGTGVVTSGAVQKTSKARERWEEEEGEDPSEEDEESAPVDPAVGEQRPTVVVVDH